VPDALSLQIAERPDASLPVRCVSTDARLHSPNRFRGAGDAQDPGVDARANDRFEASSLEKRPLGHGRSRPFTPLAVGLITSGQPINPGALDHFGRCASGAFARPHAAPSPDRRMADLQMVRGVEQFDPATGGAVWVIAGAQDAPAVSRRETERHALPLQPAPLLICDRMKGGSIGSRIKFSS